MILDDIRGKIASAEMILVGLGEEFDHLANVRKTDEYEKGSEILQQAEMKWLLPIWYDYCESILKTDMAKILAKLADMLTGKNYFVVSVAMNDAIAQTPWAKGRLVMPCGSSRKLQCADGCGADPVALQKKDKKLLYDTMEQLFHGSFEPDNLKGLGICEHCHAPMILNNIYAKKYNENGYLEQWNLYTKWLQGTLNRRVLILEFGVGMQFPSVIRFPFEKIAYFNQKAEMYRIHEKLYQIAEELKGKAFGLSQNAIDCLRNL